METHERLDIERKLWTDVDMRAGHFECWPWTGSTNVRGHGQIRGKRDGKVVNLLAPRVMLKLYEPTPGRIVRHLCNNPACCNPQHLHLGTQLENIHDSIAAGTFLRRGKKGPHLTRDQGMEIRRRAATGEPRKQIAADFGITAGHVGQIAAGKYWKD